MKATIVIAALAASASGAVIDARQLRPTSRPVTTPGGTPDGTDSPITKRDPQNWPPPQFSIGRPTQSVTFFPNDPPDLSKCGLDAFVGHTSEALLFCSSLLKSGTATRTATVTTSSTTTTRTTVITTLYPPSAPSTSSAPPTSTPRPPTSTPRPPTSTPRPPTSTPSPPSSTPRPPSSTSQPPPSTVVPPSSSPSPTTTPAPLSCGVVGYTKDKAAYYFDSSGTKNTWKVCGDACKADSKCKSFGYGEANCMLFDVTADENTNLNPMSPYTFYDAACPEELPVRRHRRNDNDSEAKEEKRQIAITIALPGGPPALSSACSCLITSGPADATRTTTTTSGVKVTKTETVTRTVSMLPEDRA